MSLPRFFKVFKDEKEAYNDLPLSDRDSEETLLKEDDVEIVRPSSKPSILHRVAVISGLELANDFDKQGPGPNGEWDYWSDQNMTRRLTREEVGYLADVNGVFYATQDWHVTHCVYTWMKHYRSKWTGTTVERRSNGLDHIAHCKDVLKIRGGLQDIRTVAGIALDADDPGRTEL
ncbi:hypothetical protein Hte_008671 [Hypoxylon texense]